MNESTFGAPDSGEEAGGAGPTGTPHPLLRASGLHVALPDYATRALFRPARLRTILSDVDLTVRRGECVGLVGESGSGKTTLARALLRLVEPAAGRIAFDGRDITHAGRSEMAPLRSRFQMIFQDPLSALNPRRRVGALIAQPLLVAGRPAGDGTVAALLARVDLPAEFARRYPHQLSGGQRQRVGIARAIACSPDLIVADEICSGLDVSTQARILALLRDLRAQSGMAMVFVTHDLSVVRVLCDRVAVMREGRIVENATAGELFAAPKAQYTRELLAAVPLPEPGREWL